MTTAPRGMHGHLDFSVVVPFHNEERHVARCVEALLAQRYPADRFEIVLVDNNSTDRSAAIVAGYPRVRLLKESKSGAYAARNLGVRSTSGAIVAFTDSDCAPAPDWLAALARAMQDPTIGLVQGRRRFPQAGRGLELLADYEAAKAAYVYASGQRDIYYGYTNNMAVRRSVFLAAGPFDELARGADVLFVFRAFNLCTAAGLCYTPDAVVDHLEIDGVSRWLGKMWTYGRSYRRYSRMAPVRPLSVADRIAVLAATARAAHHSPERTLALAGLLGLGVAAYEAGRRLPSRDQ